MKRYTLLFLIVLLAGFLRFWQLGSNPPSLSWDEAAWGYNAYTLGIDGKDEFGRFLPLDYLESFGDFKPPMYAYLAVIPVKIFGLSEFSVRFPSAMFGVLTVLLTYFLVKSIFNKHRSNADQLALLSALLLAISPWHINLSRAAFEANVATFFLVAGATLFLWAVRGKRWLLIVSAIFFVFSLYTFNTARIVAPLLILTLAIGLRKELWAAKKETFMAGIVGVLVLLPTLGFLFSPQAQLRFKEVNIFSNLDIVERANQQIENDNNVWWSKLIHNRRFAYAIEYAQHYLDNFNPQFLIIKGDGNPKFSTQDVGQLYLWDLPFLLVGTLFLIRKREGFWWVIPLWLLLSIIPAATARETPHALRVETSVPMFQVIVAYGLFTAIEKVSSIKYLVLSIRIKYLLVIFACLFLILNFLYYVHGYYAHYPKEFSGEWQYGYKESIRFVASIERDFETIFVTDKLGRPYIYYLFYNKTNPQTFRDSAAVRRDAFGFTHIFGFGKYQFIDDPNKRIDHLKKILYVNIAGQEADKAEVLRKFSLLNGTPVLTVYRF